MSYESIRDKIQAGEFENMFPFPTDATLGEDPAYRALHAEKRQLLQRLGEIKEAIKALVHTMRKDYDNESFAKKCKFKEALEEEYGLQDHPKKDDIWNKAWEDGHSGGWNSVLCEYDELADLVV